MKCGSQDMTLLRAHIELGNHWVEISKRLPGTPPEFFFFFCIALKPRVE